MSRYEFRGTAPRYRLVVGWDQARISYFAQVEDLAWETGGAQIDEEAIIGDSPEEGLLLWVSGDPPVFRREVLAEALASYGKIPGDIWDRLYLDYLNS